MAPAYEAVDWAATPLGPVSGWSATLLSTVDLMMHTPFPVSLLWGPELRLVYNEAFVGLIGDKHPAALGRPVHEAAPESFEVVGPMMHAVLDGEEAILVRDALVPLRRRGFLEECHFTFSYSPVRGPGGVIGGVMNIATETTDEVIARRRFELLGNLAEQLSSISRLDQLAEVALPLLRSAAGDLHAASLRLPGVDASHGPATIPTQARTSREFILNQTQGRSVWLPLTPPGADPGHLVLSPSPQLVFDEDHHDFLRLIAALVRQSVDRVRARDAEMAAEQAHREMWQGFRTRLLPRQRGEPDRGAPHAAVARRDSPASLSAHLRRWPSATCPRRTEARWAGTGSTGSPFPTATSSSASAVSWRRRRQGGRERRTVGGRCGADPHDAARRRLRPPPRVTVPVLTGLDRALHGTAPDVEATAILAHVRPGAEGFEVRWSNAGGHPPPVMLRPDGAAEPLATDLDLALGVDPSVPRTEHSLVLTPGSTLVLSSEGLVERRYSSLTSGIEWLVGTCAGWPTRAPRTSPTSCSASPARARTTSSSWSSARDPVPRRGVASEHGAPAHRPRHRCRLVRRPVLVRRLGRPSARAPRSVAPGRSGPPTSTPRGAPRRRTSPASGRSCSASTATSP